MEIKKSFTVFQYNKFMKGIDGTDQYLSLIRSEEHCKVVGKSSTVSAKLCVLRHIFCVKDTKYKQKK
jgi:hypothetical protein